MPRRWASPAIALLAAALVAGLTQLGGFSAANATSPACVNPSPGAPGIPSALTITSVTPTDTGLSIAFTGPANGAGMQYIRVILNGSASVASGTTSPVTVSGLSPATDYSVVICGGAPGGDGDPSSAVSTRTLGDAPAPRANPPAAPSLDVSVTDASVTVTPRIGDDGGSAITAVDVSIGGQSFRGNPGQSFTRDGLEPGQSIDVSATVSNAVGTSNAAVTTARTAGSAPSAPGSLAVRPFGQRDIEISWSAASANGTPITGYEVTANGAPACSVPAATLRCTIARPTGTAVQVGVRAMARTLAGPAASGSFTLPITAPGVVASLQVRIVDCGANRADCPWLRTRSTSLFVVATWRAPVNDGGSPATSVLVKVGDRGCDGQASGACRLGPFAKRYEIAKTATAVASNGAGPGPTQSVAVGDTWTDASVLPRPPKDLRATGEDRAIAVRWTVPTLADGPLPDRYLLTATCEGACSAAPPVTAECDPLAPEQCRITGLAGRTSYRVDAVASSDLGRSDPASANATTTGAPEKPAAPTAAWSGSTLTVRWLPVSGTGLTYRLDDDRGTVACAASNATQCSPTPRAFPTRYSVVAINADGSTASDLSQPAGVVALPKLTNIRVERLGVREARIRWDVPSLPAGAQPATALVQVPARTECAYVGDDYCGRQVRSGPPTTFCSAPVAEGSCLGTMPREITDDGLITVQGPPGADGPTATFPISFLFVPSKPESARIQSFGDASLTVGWTPSPKAAAEGLTGYRVSLHFNGAQERSCDAGPAATSCTATGLVRGREYTIYVSARIGLRDSESITLYAQTGPPGAPRPAAGFGEPVRLLPAGRDGIQVSWSPPTEVASPVTGYEARTSDGRTCTTTGLSCVITGVAPAAGSVTTVTVTARASNAFGFGPATTPMGLELGRPGPVTATLWSSGRDTLRVAWTPDENGPLPTEYTVLLDGQPTRCATSATTRSCEMPVPKPYQRHWAVADVTPSVRGLAGPTTPASVELPRVPARPVQLRAIPAENGGLLVSWDAAPGPVNARDYSVYITQRFDGSNALGCRVRGDQRACYVTKMGGEPLVDGERYFLTVIAEGVNGNSGPSDLAVGVPGNVAKASGPPSPPRNLKVTLDASRTWATFSWDRPQDLKGADTVSYRVIGATSASSFIEATATTSTRATFKLAYGVAPDATATFVVQAVTSGGASEQATFEGPLR